jgi:hypothetical protein
MYNKVCFFRAMDGLILGNDFRRIKELSR